ncbi:DUF3108 domain-containing protein [Dysgonomonas sp. 520]|uniref:DUF3108 domain-containing protein n=1 Tax=Dysgonomonas sp. 520 TaxID=2302931 RepID=UPI0013D5E0EF|nr:DUF3108 domain-containing protein [Dysgonomonas sp. 520]NDW08402.1 DUF3108 domain-containing protein [Dysgonomonas sp. 520]
MIQSIKKIAISLGLLSIFAIPSLAQCTLPNSAFQGGEFLQYDLYFKYGLINTKAGNASLRTTSTTYNGQSAYRIDMLTKSTGVVDAAFSVDDTLKAFVNTGLAPLAFFKYAHEDGDYNVERINYTYANNAVSISTTRTKNGKHRYTETINTNQCTYDFVSVVSFARALNYPAMKNGNRTRISFISGKKRQNMDIVLQGTETIKANDGKKYSCYKLSLVTSDDAFQNKKEAMKIYLSADSNRIPIRIESSLKIGSMRVILKRSQGLKN